jgi:hypothetical protein
MPETETWRYRGQTIDREQIAFLREFIREHPPQQPLETVAAVVRGSGVEAGQRRVARRGLPRPDADAGAGRRDRVAGGAPTYPRPAPDGASAAGSRPDRHHAAEMPLGALGAIEIQLVRRTADEPLFESLMEEFHYLRYEQPVGEHLKYLVWAQGRPVACLAWSSAPRHLASRDRFIGWSGEARRRNIRYLAYNTRFLILPWVEVPHLASHILGRMARQISEDWERIYGHPIYYWRPSSIRNDSAGPVIGRRTGYCWGEPRGAAKTIRPIGRTGRSKKCSHFHSIAGFTSYYRTCK